MVLCDLLASALFACLIATLAHHAAGLHRPSFETRRPSIALFNAKGAPKKTSSSNNKGNDGNNDGSRKWRIYNVEVLLEDDPGKDNYSVHDKLLHNTLQMMGIDDNFNSYIDSGGVNVTIARKSFDGRWKKAGQPKFVYTVDVDITKKVSKEIRLRQIDGKFELLPIPSSSSLPLPTKIFTTAADSSAKKKKSAIIVGAGPAGLFCAIELISKNIIPIVIERGQPVEVRGRDIGSFINRKILDENSNFCYGEGGAGTWSDGKLTTRIGKNSDDVRKVLQTLVEHGADKRILLDGKPHVGTDGLVRILRDVRKCLISQGAVFHFDTKVEDVLVDEKSGRVTGVELVAGGRSSNSDGIGGDNTIRGDVVVLAVGHSSRDLYQRLIDKGALVESKPIAVGFRIEHPQELINSIQYGEFGNLCQKGKGIVPVADYRLTAEVDLPDQRDTRACYSFCMCPGGQIVCTSVRKEELCLNGMSFSQRQSKWANSALVVNVKPEDMEEVGGTSPFRGVVFQRFFESKAAVYGGGNFVAPVQRATDFIEGRLSNSPIVSSYRLGVREARCDEIFPSYITDALKKSLLQFDKRMPGFLSPDAILHGVETRTSSPVQIVRDEDTMQCKSFSGLFPIGEGAGYAGGIVSAAVDGLKAGRKIVEFL